MAPPGGGASATVAKTISAYDKEVSNEIYGADRVRLSKSTARDAQQRMGIVTSASGDNTRSEEQIVFSR